MLLQPSAVPVMIIIARQKWQIMSWRRFIKIIEKFDTKAKTNHLTRTADSYRQLNMTKGILDNVTRLSADVKGLKLKFPTKIDFKAGQWVDLMVPEMDEVGGFSICSAPYEMEESNTMQLAVKNVLHTVAEQCHRIELFTEVAVRVGGDFFFEPSKDSLTENILLIAGGVGINPLFSILKQTLYEDEKNDYERKVNLLYSAKTEMDLLFREEILDLNALYDNFEARFFVTQGENLSQNILINPRRLSVDDWKPLIENTKYTKIFICGPPPMTDFIMDSLHRLNFPRENIFIEKWW